MSVSLKKTRLTTLESNSERPKFTVLLPVYKNDRPDWFKQSLDSVLNQTLVPDEVLIVVDGAIPDSLSSVINQYNGRVKVTWIPENKGLWNALNVGIEVASSNLIARMDADDVSTKDRFEKQVAEFEEDRDLALLGGQIIEFIDKTDDKGAQRRVPLSQDAIVKFAKYRSPFNHPTVMFRKSMVQRVGGYHELYRTEDYDLWVRMIQAEMKMKNLPDVLLYYRTNSANSSRKATSLQHEESLALQKRMRSAELLSWGEYLISRTGRFIFYYSPSSLKRFVYNKLLRKG